MLNSVAFAACIREQLSKKGFGKKRQDDIIYRYEGLRNSMAEQGIADAETQAAAKVFEELSEAQRERYKTTLDGIRKHTMHAERIAQAKDVKTSMLTLDGKKGGPGTAIGRALVSFIENDQRFGGLSYATLHDVYYRQLLALFDDKLNDIGKGAFGVQRGKAILENVVKELWGVKTGDEHAAAIAKSWRAANEAGVDLINLAGGSLHKLEDFRISQHVSAARLLKITSKDANAFVNDALNRWDWDRMRWPNGDVIKPEQRIEVAKYVEATLRSNGAEHLDETRLGGGRGTNIGNMLNQNRFVFYKTADDWLAMHQKYGEGSIFDVMTSHLSHMAHNAALISAFGRNPIAAAQNMRIQALKAAAAYGPKELAKAEAIIKNKFQPMFDIAIRHNPTDPNSGLGAAIVGLSNILTAAQLGSASLAAIPGDWMTKMFTQMSDGMGAKPFRTVDTYIRALATLGPGEQMRIANQCGFVGEQVVASIYASQRFTGIATYGPAISKRIADVVLRASGMAGHTSALRWAAQAEFMGMMAAERATAFNDLPFLRIAKRYGISETEWNVFKEVVQDWSPNEHQSVKFMRPIDILKSDKLVPEERQALFNKFQSMILNESRDMVPDSTIEATAQLRGASRPDTLSGALLHSFSMYKNFGVTMVMKYGRLALTHPSTLGRVAYVGSLVSAMTLVGALTQQMREISKGNDPLPMGTFAFWGKSFTYGGGAGIYGDFLFSGINDPNRDVISTAAGPIAGFASDAKQLVFGEPFAFFDAMDQDKTYEPKLPARALSFAQRYTPGSNLWWSRLVVERAVWDNLRRLTDPRADAFFAAKRRKQYRTYGNESWWAPGDTSPTRIPQ